MKKLQCAALSVFLAVSFAATDVFGIDFLAGDADQQTSKSDNAKKEGEKSGGIRSNVPSFGLNDPYTRYFTDPNIPPEFPGMSEVERVLMVESLARDSWYLNLRVGTDQDKSGPAGGVELVFNFFDHVGLGAGLGVSFSEYTGSDAENYGLGYGSKF